MSIRLQSLQKITDLKNRLTQQANWHYAESMNLLAQEQSKLMEMLQTHDRMVQELHEKTVAAVPVQELHDWTNYLLLQRAQIEQQGQSIKSQEQVCQDKQAQLTDRFVDEQKWIRFQDRRLLEHRATVEKAWQEVLDELAVTGYQRKRG